MPLMNSKLTIVVSGMIAADPHQGGASWAVLQYLLGFRQLGHDVYFIEPIPAESLQPAGVSLPESANATYFRQVAADFGQEQSAAIVLAGTRQTVGSSYDELHSICRRADLLVNISGMLTDAELIGRIPVRVYLDLDPAFVQMWHAIQGINMRFDGHTHFVTVGLEIGITDCRVPTAGRHWLTTLQPLVLSYWPMADAIVHDGLTTVGNWRGYGSIEHVGVLYGQKAHSMRPFMALPTLTRERLMPALSIHPHETKDLEALAANGWRLLDPAEVARSPAAYRSFIQGSKAEFGIAKSGYVASRCGWFSDRSVCYLVSGRPVLAQDTGFREHLPTGVGLLAFETIDDVLAGIDAINGDYENHRRAARAIAEEYFDSDIVLTRLLEKIGASS